MRIAFVGKGGSGKTTAAALFARHLAACGKPVLVIDADINQHLAETIGAPKESMRELPTLGANIPFIKEYLHGENPRIPSALGMAKTTPPGTGSRLMRFAEKNPLFEKFIYEHEGIRIMKAGAFTESDLGVSCYHSKTSAVELLLNHLVDGEGEYIVVDMTAGADAFASGLFAAFDLTAVVVEPTWKSAEVLEDYRRYSKGFETPLIVLGNKITNDADKQFVTDKNGGIEPIYITASEYVRRSERDGCLPIADLELENAAVLGQLKEKLDARKKDWDAYLKRMHMFHKKNAESWANKAYGTNLLEQIDPDFTYPAE